MSPTKMKRAAMYCRSSKDRSDVSIDAQRRELRQLAEAKGLTVVERFEDTVERANDANRPGLQKLVAALKRPDRDWDTLLVLDTSRLARDEYLAIVFAHELKKHKVQLLYAKIPEVANPAINSLVVAVMRAFDQMHSMLSREKGLAGMAENVKQGFRAGGRASFGYELAYTETGALRDGLPVRKSKLSPVAEKASIIAAYLKGRAVGRTRASLVAELNLALPTSSLVGIEWQALTYAGHTVWNVHNSRDSDGAYESGTKRRPREEWVVTRDTHPALITDAEAEAILARLQANPGRRTRGAEYLLSGLLLTQDGRNWHGNDGFYRAGRTNVAARPLEKAIINKVCEDLDSDAFVESLLRRVRDAEQPKSRQSVLATLAKRIGNLNQKIDRVTNLLVESEAPRRPLLAKLAQLEAERAELESQRAVLETEADSARRAKDLTPEVVRAMLRQIASSTTTYPRDQVKDLLRSVIGKITLTKVNPGEVTACLDYEIPAVAGDTLASPRGFEPLLPP